MNKINEFNLLKKYNINADAIEVRSNSGIEIDFREKQIIIEKLLEAKELAFSNLKKGNITRRAFGANVFCESENMSFWKSGTNFNNTRNDISSICAERSAIINAYNHCLKHNIKEFKIKYIVMAQALDLEDIRDSIIPCEDCLSWFNTKRFLDNDTIVFTFERKMDKLFIHAVKLDELLPYRGILTSNVLSNKIEYSQKAKQVAKKIDALNLIKIAKQAYDDNNLTKISNQNIACAVLTDKKTYKAAKIDWTRRWFMEPLELAVSNALQEENDLKINAVAYFGDEVAKTNQGEFIDNVVSIKSLGRIRQKYASSDTLLILNFSQSIFVMTLSEYLPRKFVQGYEIK